MVPVFGSQDSAAFEVTVRPNTRSNVSYNKSNDSRLTLETNEHNVSTMSCIQYKVYKLLYISDKLLSA